MRRSPRSSKRGIKPWAPILVLVIVAVAGTTILTTTADLGDLMVRQAQQSPQGANMTEEQQEALRQRMNGPAVRVIAYIPVVILPLMMAVVAGIYFGLFLLLGSSAGYKQFLC